MNELWTERYRPKTIDEYVFIDQSQKDIVKQWIKSGSIPNLLLSGVPGSGKTTLARVLLNELGVHASDIKFINASKESRIDNMRDTIDNFCSIMPYGDFRYVILDEADYLSKNSQAALRNPMEDPTNSVRFILTCNYPHKIIPAIHSRCQSFHIDKMDKTEYTVRMAQILLDEHVEFDVDTLEVFVADAYPDLRKCINNCQQHSTTGKLVMPEKIQKVQADYRLNAIALFRERKYTEARNLICSQITDEEYEDFYRFMYNNIDIWAGTDGKKINETILAIRDGLVKDACVGDREINLSATLASLELIATT